MLKSLTRSYLINVFALFVAAQYIGGFHLSEGAKSLLLVAGGFTILHLLIKTVLGVFLGVLNFLSLGLIGLLVDSVILYALTVYLPQVSISPWFFPGLVVSGFVIPPFSFNFIEATVLSALVISLIRSILSTLI